LAAHSGEKHEWQHNLGKKTCLAAYSGENIVGSTFRKKNMIGSTFCEKT
jgi:hypothetical protein